MKSTPLNQIEDLLSIQRDLALRLSALTRLDEGLLAFAVLPVRHKCQVIGCINLASHTLDEVPLLHNDKDFDRIASVSSLQVFPT